MRTSNLWDSELVAGVAFRPHKCRPSQSSRWIDGTFSADDGADLAYRLYKGPSNASEVQVPGPLLIYFHANAELCTDLEGDVSHFFDCGFSLVLCPEYRGYAWSEGKPSLKRLYPDSEALIQALPSIFRSGGIEAADVQIVLHGRSLGTASAIHLASLRDSRVRGLIVESGVMDLLKLPMVLQIGMMMPQLLQALKAEPCPLKTLEEMQQVAIPTLIIHGDLDEISPVEQAVWAHRACSSERKLIRYPRAGHNDLRLLSRKEYFREVRSLCERVVTGNPEALAAPETGQSWLGMVSDFIANGSALKCLPGMRRCFVGSADDFPPETPR